MVRPRFFCIYDGVMALMLRLPHPAGMYTRLFRPALERLMSCAGHFSAPFAHSGKSWLDW